MNTRFGKPLSRIALLLAMMLQSFTASFAADPVKGKELFNSQCATCHAIDKKMIGPALAGVSERREEAWLLKWIKDSPGMIKSGDALAVKLFEENNKLAMNAFPDLSDEDIKSILAYIATGGEKAAAETGGGTETGGVAVPPASGTGNGTPTWMIVVILLGLFIIIVQVFNILKLISEYTGRNFFNPNRTNALLMLAFLVLGMIGVIWEFIHHGPLADIPSASEHGDSVDRMFDITLYITGFVFVVTQVLLFWFSYRYQHKTGHKATFYAHNNRLEVIWTVIPAIALTILVLNGFNMWSKITDKAPEDAHEIEVFAYQFGWKARYPGADKTLGNANFNLISGTNELGVAVQSEYEKILAEAKETKAKLEEEAEFLGRNTNPTPEEQELIDENAKRLKRASGHLARLEALVNSENLFNGAGDDDFIPTEIHIPVDEPVLLRFRSRDVIHSAYMPYFRVQMNCVPGMPTQFWFVPTKTTAEIRTEKNDPNFDYYLFCAKICGAAHFNMKIKVVVESKADYKKWLANQKPRFNRPAQASSN